MEKEYKNKIAKLLLFKELLEKQNKFITDNDLDKFEDEDDFDKEKFINEFIIAESTEDMMSFLNKSLNKHNLPKYIDQKEIQKFLDEK